ncbi:Transmembrane protein, partial [Phytophthora megakarya]
TVGVILGELLVGFCFNGEEYGGDFNFSLSFPQLTTIMTVLTAPAVPITWIFIKEEKTQRINFRKYINEFWDLLCKPVVYQVIAYHFFSTNTVVIVVDCAVTLITVWDVFRSQWFWLGPPMTVQILSGVSWIIALFVTVEIAGVGNEGAVYGTNTRVQVDDYSIRMDITYTIIISYVMTIFSWTFMVLLPKQKQATQELARTGGSSKFLGGLTIAYLKFSPVWSVTMNTLAALRVS